MKLTHLAQRVAGKGADAWDIHYAAISRQNQGDNIIVLSIGQEMLETTPSLVVDAAIESLRSGRHHYSEIGGELHLRETLAKRYSTQFERTLTADNVAVLAGAQNGLFCVSLCTLQKGDEVIIIEPYYATYPATFSVGGAKVVAVSTQPENDFVPSIDDVVRCVSDDTRAIVINTPHNPAGVVYGTDFLNELLAICRSKKLLLISDEVYSALADPGTFVSPASLPNAFEHCVTVSSISKSHRMTGWRVGWVIADKFLIDQLFNLSICMSYGLPMFTQDAADAALKQSATVEPKVRHEVNRKRQLVVEKLKTINNLVVRGSKCGMFVVVDVRNMPVSATDFAWRLLNQYDVAILPCRAFGDSGKGMLRINIGESDANLAVACERIAKLAADLS